MLLLDGLHSIQASSHSVNMMIELREWCHCQDIAAYLSERTGTQRVATYVYYVL